MDERHPRRRTRRENDDLVLGLLEAAERPISAYDIAGMARSSGINLVPNQVYRTLARLLEQRAARRIEILNAYLPWKATADLCLVCVRCHTVKWIELPSLGQSLARAIAGSGFRASTGVMEMLGRCPKCRGGGIAPNAVHERNVQ